eukprot:2657347-Lingulodinium_polyedra.AAC.1
MFPCNALCAGARGAAESISAPASYQFRSLRDATGHLIIIAFSPTGHRNLSARCHWPSLRSSC